MRMRKLLVGLLVVFMMAGCAASKTRQVGHGAGKGTSMGLRFGAVGAGVGAVLGAIGGAVIGHDSHSSGEGAGVGAFMGALVGGFVDGAVRGDTRPLSDDEALKRLKELKEQLEDMKEQLSGMKEVPEQLQEMGSSIKEIQKKLDEFKAAVDSLLKRAETTGKMSTPAETLPVLEGIREELGLKDIYFDFGRSLVTAEARKILERNGRWLKAHSGVRVYIEGHCDERGTVEYNLALGERRAKLVQKELIALGVNKWQVVDTISFGEERPIDPGRNEVAYAKNRRAHFVVISPKK